MCLREAGKQDGRLYLATLAADRLLPSTCVCVFTGVPSNDQQPTKHKRRNTARHRRTLKNISCCSCRTDRACTHAMN